MVEKVYYVDRSKRFKVIVIGDPAVGKTSLIHKFTKVKIMEKYLPTVGASITKEPVEIREDYRIHKVHLLIWDIAGHEKFKMLYNVYFKGAHAVILMFDLSREETLKNVRYWYGKIREFLKEENPIIILVGNKRDLPNQLSKDKIENMKKEIGVADYFETSAKTGENVHDVFSTIAEKLFRKSPVNVGKV